MVWPKSELFITKTIVYKHLRGPQVLIEVISTEIRYVKFWILGVQEELLFHIYGESLF
jgi:hypothetical protein